MSGQLAMAFVRIRADTSLLKKDIAQGIKEGAAAGGAESDAESAGSRSGKSYAKGFATAAKVGLAAVIAIGVASVDAAIKFQATMTRVQTQAGASAGDVKTLTAQVLKLAPATQQGPQQLAEALYHLKSVGMDNVSAMRALKTASDLAAVGGANLEDTTNAIAAAWRSGIKGAQNFGAAAATVNAIIGAGNMTMGDFVSAMGTGLLSAATTFGVSLKQVGGALALMTDEGVPAVDAATRLKMSFSLLAAPSQQASKYLKTIGITGLQLANTMRSSGGLVSTIALLKQHLDASGMSASQQAILLSRAFGGGRSSSAILTMINNLSTLKQKQDQINDGIGKYGADVARQRQTVQAQLDQLKSGFETLGIRIGSALLPPLNRVVQFINQHLTPAVSTVTGFVSKLLGRGGGKITPKTGKPQPVTPALSSVVSNVRRVGGLTGQNGPGITASDYTKAGPKTAAKGADKSAFSIGTSIAQGLVKQAGKIGQAILTMFGSIDWGKLGSQAANNAVPFLVGFINGLGTAFINELEHHPLDLISAIASLIPVGRVGGVLADVLEHIPFLRVLAPLLRGLETAGKAVERPVFGIFKKIFSWVIDKLPSTLKDGLGNVGRFLLGEGEDLLVKLAAGAGKGWRAAGAWFKELGGRVISAVGKLAGKLLGPGLDLIEGLLKGAKGKWGDVVTWAKGLGGKVIGFFAKAGTWLFNAGKAVLTGFWNGAKAIWKDVTGFFGGIGGWIADHKGPIEKDRKLLVPHGKAIMDGLLEGLKSRVGALTSFLKGVATTVTALAKEPGSQLASQLATAAKQQTSGKAQLAKGTSAVNKLKSARAQEENQIKKLIASREREDKADAKGSKALRAEQEKQIKSLRKLRSAQESQIKTIDAALRPLKSELSKLKSEIGRLQKAIAKQAKASTSSSSDDSGDSDSGSDSSGPPNWAAFNQWMTETGPIDVTGASGGSSMPSAGWQGNPGPFGGFGVGVGLPPRPGWFDGQPDPAQQRAAQIASLTEQHLRELIGISKQQPAKTAAGLNAALNGVSARAIVRGNW